MLAFVDDAALARRLLASRSPPRNAVYVYRLELSDRAVVNMPVRPRMVSGRLISLRRRPSTAATTPCPAPPPSPRPPARPPPRARTARRPAAALMRADAMRILVLLRPTIARARRVRRAILPPPTQCH